MRKMNLIELTKEIAKREIDRGNEPPDIIVDWSANVIDALQESTALNRAKEEQK